MIKVLSGKIEELDMKETLRYLGYAGVKSADGIEGVLEECRGMILPVLAPKAVYEEFPLIHGQENRLDLGFAKAVSHSLPRNLAGCSKPVVFAAPVRAGQDRLSL